MYSPFDLNIRAIIRESVDYIIKTLDIHTNIDCTDDKQVDSNDKSTLDFIVVNVPTILESGDYSILVVEEP
jgi:hypothetical protein